MIITLSDDAKGPFKEMYGIDPIRIFITQGCCGKSFGFEPKAQKREADVRVMVDEIVFLADDETQKIAPNVEIAYPGPIDGFMVTNKNAIGGCACGRSFFVEE